MKEILTKLSLFLSQQSSVKIMYWHKIKVRLAELLKYTNQSNTTYPKHSGLCILITP